MSNGKVVGMDGISVQLFMMALNCDPVLRQRLLDIVVSFWTGENIPHQFINATIRVIIKRGRTVCGNYRGISLVAHFEKIFLNKVAHRLGDYGEYEGILSTEQSDFQSNHSTTDIMFVIH